ncbi:hypothetical protein MKW94_030254 [Papaver nudicaule]|uniref:INO80 complex subunit B-like conserved region domain-containing protein n=1 Tax=Papaver nudicaule TaxID=74823 RepID=A0AA41SJ37_PAPNU|nr:hypothetical protein [Papaver nudicaule]
MEGLKGCALDSAGNSIRKKRSNMPRRPRADDITGYDSTSRSALGVSAVDRVGGAAEFGGFKRSRTDDGASREHGDGSSRGHFENGGGSGSDFVRCSKGSLAPANWKSVKSVEESLDLHSRKKDNSAGNVRIVESRSLGNSGVNSDGLGNENKLRKVKLKVGGVTHTIHTKPALNGASGDGSGSSSSMKTSQSVDASRPRKKLVLQDSDDDNSPSEAVRKSKRVPKPRLLDEAFDDGNDDEEIRYLERLKTSKAAPDYATEYGDDGEERSKKHRKISMVLKTKAVGDQYDDDLEHGSSKDRDGTKNSRSKLVNEDADFVGEEDPASDGELEHKKEASLTSRQRALQSGKDISAGSGASLIEFPNGLPPAPSRKQKDKLSEVEQQIKKAEAAHKRKTQAEKAARESEAEAIRKILGQDSSRKKKEDKLQKRRDEIAQERTSNSALSSNTVRWVIGPTGTVVIFPNEIGLPNIFDSKPCSYPPPRAKCAGPSCTNTYRYRDSKSNLPLCSLQCYKAIHEQMQPVSTC